MTKHPYVKINRRRRSSSTDYKARRKMIAGSSPLLAVRISTKNASVQFISPKVEGDHVLASAHSRALRKLGWKGPLKSIPACYLLGLLAGKTAKGKGVTEAHLYNGLSRFTNGSRVSALVKGVREAGVAVPMSDEALPPEDKVSGKAIADYASVLLKDDKEKYSRLFSGLLRSGFKPEEYTRHTTALKRAITESR